LNAKFDGGAERREERESERKLCMYVKKNNNQTMFQKNNTQAPAHIKARGKKRYRVKNHHHRVRKKKIA
jgi:hypothetical protein